MLFSKFFREKTHSTSKSSLKPELRRPKKRKPLSIASIGVVLTVFTVLTPLAYMFNKYISTDIMVDISLSPGTSQLTDSSLEDLANRAAAEARDKAISISDKFKETTLDGLLGWSTHEKDGTYCSRRTFIDLGLVQQIMAASGAGPQITNEDALDKDVVQIGPIPSMFSEFVSYVRETFKIPYKRLRITLSHEGSVWKLSSRIEHYWDRGQEQGWGLEVHKRSAFAADDTELESEIARTILRVSYPAIASAGLSYRGVKDMDIEQFLMPSLSPQHRILALLSSLNALDSDADMNQASKLEKAISVRNITFELQAELTVLSENSSDQKNREKWKQLAKVIQINWSTISRQINSNFKISRRIETDPIFSSILKSGLISRNSLSEFFSDDQKLNNAIKQLHVDFVETAKEGYTLDVPEASRPIVRYFLSMPFKPQELSMVLDMGKNSKLPVTFPYLLNSLLFSEIELAQFDNRPNKRKQKYFLLTNEIERLKQLFILLPKLSFESKHDRNIVTAMTLSAVLNLALAVSHDLTPDAGLTTENALREVQSLVRENIAVNNQSYASFVDLALELQIALQRENIDLIGSLVDESARLDICAAAYLHHMLARSLKNGSSNQEKITRHYIRSAQNLISRGMKNFSIYNALGVALSEVGEIDASIEAYQRARRYGEGSIPWAYSNESRSHLVLGDFQSAANAARAALTNGFDFVAARHNLLLALFLSKDTHGFARSISEYYEHIVGENASVPPPRSSDYFSPENVRQFLGLMSCTTGADVSEFLKSRGHENLVSDLMVEPCLNASESYAYIEIELVNHYADLRPLTSHLQAQRFLEAARAAKNLLLKEPDNALAHALLGRANQALGKPQDAMLNFSAAIDLGIDWPSIFVERAVHFAQVGDKAAADADLEEANKSLPLEGVRMYSRALVELASSNTDKGLDILENVGNAFPNDPHPWLIRAQSLRDTGRLHEAFSDLEISRKKFKGDDLKLRIEQGFLLEALNRRNEAFKIFDEITEVYQQRVNVDPTLIQTYQGYLVAKGYLETDQASGIFDYPTKKAFASCLSDYCQVPEVAR